MKDFAFFNDSGLEGIEFSHFGRDLRIRFCSCYNGEYIGMIECERVMLFHYSDFRQEFTDESLNELDEGFFGEYVAEVLISKVDDYFKIQFEPMLDNFEIHCKNYAVIKNS